MTITHLNGADAVNAASESEFAGMASPRRYRIDPKLAEHADALLESAFRGEWGAEVRLAEAFSTSDFKMAAFASIDTEMLRRYQTQPTVWQSYCDQTPVNDFRPKRLVVDGEDSDAYQVVPEGTEYPAADGTNRGLYAIAVLKYGRRKAITWEAWKNNEAIDELGSLPDKLSKAAVNTEALNAVANLLKVDPLTNKAASINTDFFKTANGNAPDNKPFTRENVQAAINGMATRKDPVSGRTIARPDVVVVIPKSLEAQAIAIFSPQTVRIETTDANGVKTTTEQANPLAGTTYVVEPMLDYVHTHAKAATTWFVVPKPGGPRPALWTAKLRGYETPDLRIKADAGQRVGGGLISPLEGSFEIDDIQFRGRHIVGHQTADPLFTYASYGQ